MTDVQTPDAVMPAAYSAFTPIFERLSAPMLQVMKGQLEQFERLALEFRRPEPAERGEFQGLGGLTRRGDLSHIVQSELLLRDEAPLEFLRRLAESETVYLEKQYADPGARAIYRAMISAGPGLLGHGRMVALAALIFMARRAAVRRARFHWCFLPRGEGAVWFDEVSLNGVKRLLRSASYREMTVDDMDEAVALWTRLMAEDDARPGSEPIDWVIGARPSRSVEGLGGATPAVQAAANSLSFSLFPSLPGQPRAADLRLRQGRRDQGGAAVVFPDDMVCVGALRNPFRPPAATPRSTSGAPLAPIRREAPGWAPEHFIVTAAEMKTVRLPEGLLFLAVDRKGHVRDRWFAPLPSETQLAGFGFQAHRLSLLLQTGADGGDTLVHRRFDLLPGGRGAHLVDARRVTATTEHLFRRHPAAALPILSDFGPIVRFHSASGQPFQLTLPMGGSAVTFTPEHKASRILHSNGAQKVMQADRRRERCDFRVLRANGEWLDSYRADAELEDGADLREVLYSHPFQSLAYSRAPNQWILSERSYKAVHQTPGVGRPAEGLHPFTLKPSDVLLSARLQNGIIQLRLWSDARQGGSGEVQNIHLKDDEVLSRQTLFRLGDDALGLVKLMYTDDGALWGLKTDGDGVPQELLTWRRHKGDNRSVCVRIDLGHQLGEAARLDLERVDV